MPTPKKKKPTPHKNMLKDEELDQDMMTDDSEDVDDVEELPARYAYSNKPPYLLVVLLMAISFFAGYLLFKVMSLQQKLNTTAGAPTAAAGQPAAQAPREIKIKKPSTDEHWRGDKNARYVWVEYSDYECPFCKTVHPSMVKLLGEYTGKMAWVFRQFPLPFHPKAQKSAEGSECANEMGGNDAFWKYSDEMFDKMPNLELTELPNVASDIGLDATAFKDCVDSGKYEKKVKDMSNEGTQAGVQATPTGVIYDMQTGKSLAVEGALPYDSLKQQLDSFMAQNK